jgi:hypothetical protein
VRATDLPVAAETIVSAELRGGQFVLRTDRGSEFQVESPAVIDGTDGTSRIDPGDDATADSCEEVEILGTIEAATAGATGELRLVVRTAAGRTTVTVAADPDFEAWTLVTGSGARVVCAPGGELVTWGPDS